MLITRKSAISGITRTRDLPITEEQMSNWQNGMLIQEAFPHLSPGDREFILTGSTNEEWDDLFSDDEDPEDPDSGSPF
jgi:hypothetical protein